MKKLIFKTFLIALCIVMLIAAVSCDNNSTKKESTKDGTKNSDSKSDEDIKNSEKKESLAGSFENDDKKRVKAKGLYLTATSAGSRLDHYIELANKTEINSYIIDFKDDDGYVCFDSKNETAKEVKAVDVRYDPKKVVKELQKNDIYAIARIVCFKDPILAGVKTDQAIHNLDGSLFIHNNMAWLNPYNNDNWEYNLDLAKEAIEYGFDEVQFDYVRFPDGKKSNMDFAKTNDNEMHEQIEAFLAKARKELPKEILSADIFAITLESPEDNEQIGQYYEKVGENMDYLCPMAYPSHYALGQIINGVEFPKPDKDPGGVVKQTLLKGKSRLEKVKDHKPILRTYIQDFTASWIGEGNYQEYGATQVREQIEGVYAAGYEEWICWDPMNTYSEDAFKKE
ncbi:MAG: putative glycoside hydrolase [Clostridiales bacterium]